MTNKYTPGPWISQGSVDGGRPPEAGCAVIASDTEISISNPSRGIVAWASRLVGRTNEETLANALLIAAAPDLLAACKSVLDLVESGDSPDFDLLIAAIDKAEGAS